MPASESAICRTLSEETFGVVSNKATGSSLQARMDLGSEQSPTNHNGGTNGSGEGENTKDSVGNNSVKDEREELLEQLVEREQTRRLVVVMLGRRQDIMQRVANQITHAINYQLSDALPPVYRNTQVLVAADIQQVLQLWREYEYHTVAAIVVHPDEEDGGQLSDILNRVDYHRVTDLNREPILTPQGTVDVDATAREINASLLHHNTVIRQAAEQHTSTGAVTPSGLLTQMKLSEYGQKLEEYMISRATPALRDGWQRRVEEEVTRTKRTVLTQGGVSNVPVYAPTEKEVEEAIRVLSTFNFPPIDQAHYQARLSQSDSRRVDPEVGRLIDIILAATAHGKHPSITHFFQHATRGVIGLFPPDVQAVKPEDVSVFIKPYKTETEVEAHFVTFDRLRQRNVRMQHEPLAYHESTAMGEFAVVSRSPLLAITAKVAEQIRQLGKPQLEEAYLDALMDVNIEALVNYRIAAERVITEVDMVRALHKYKMTLKTARDDVQRSTGIDLTELEERAAMLATGVFDNLSFWNPRLFGQIIDDKTYNHGNKMGTVNPTPELVKAVLFGNAIKPDGAIDKAAVKANMVATYGFLEHADRLGIVLEDYFHTVNSPDLRIRPDRKPAYYEAFIRALMPEATDAALSGIWPAYFVMEAFKSIRKMQRTAHYMITNQRSEEDSTERGNNHRLYIREYQAYRDLLAQTAFASAVLLTDHATEQFPKQLKVLGQLYSQKIPPPIPRPDLLPPVPRALYLLHTSLERVLEGRLEPARLRRLEVLR